MIANYGDVIPRRDFEQLTKDHAKLLDDDEQRKADYTKLKQEHEWALELCLAIFVERGCTNWNCEIILPCNKQKESGVFFQNPSFKQFQYI